MKNCKFYLVFFAATFAIACGSSSSTTPTSDTVTITGTLNSGTITTSASKAATPASGHMVVAVDNASNKTYNATTDSAGNFSMEVPANTQLLVGLISNGTYVGPMVFDGTGSEVNTVIKPSANTDLGSVVLDSDSGYARADTKPSATDTSIVAEATNGKPKGAGNDGKTQNAGITNRTDSDKDKDSIPNIFDADEDNDGIRNGIASDPSGKTVVSDYIESVYMSSNIWALHGEDLPEGSQPTDVAPNLISIWLNVVPKTGQESKIASVQCTDVPVVIKDVATVRFSSSIGDPLNYPSEHPLWKDSSYNLYKTTTLAREQWIISLKPAATMSVGDAFTIRVTYTDSTYEDFYIPMSYILTDWARITTYNSTALTSSTGSRTAPATFSGDSLTIVFSKPLDEDGNVLDGLSYSVQYGLSTQDPSSGNWNVSDSRSRTETSTGITDNGDDTFSFTVPTDTAGTYNITPVAESADGQRNGDQTWFTRP